MRPFDYGLVAFLGIVFLLCMYLDYSWWIAFLVAAWHFILIVIGSVVGRIIERSETDSRLRFFNPTN